MPDSGPAARTLGLAALVALAACALLALLLVAFTDEPRRRRTAITEGPGDPSRATVLDGEPTRSAASGDTPGGRFAEGLVLAPRMIEGRRAGYLIASLTGAATVSGLRPGDILIDLDGRPLEPARLEALGEELSSAGSLEITYQRDGHIRRRVIDLTR